MRCAFGTREDSFAREEKRLRCERREAPKAHEHACVSLDPEIQHFSLAPLALAFSRARFRFSREAPQALEKRFGVAQRASTYGASKAREARVVCLKTPFSRAESLAPLAHEKRLISCELRFSRAEGA